MSLTQMLTYPHAGWQPHRRGQGHAGILAACTCRPHPREWAPAGVGGACHWDEQGLPCVAVCGICGFIPRGRASARTGGHAAGIRGASAMRGGRFVAPMAHGPTPESGPMIPGCRVPATRRPPTPACGHCHWSAAVAAAGHRHWSAAVAAAGHCHGSAAVAAGHLPAVDPQNQSTNTNGMVWRRVLCRCSVAAATATLVAATSLGAAPLVQQLPLLLQQSVAAAAASLGATVPLVAAVTLVAAICCGCPSFGSDLLWLSWPPGPWCGAAASHARCVRDQHSFCTRVCELRVPRPCRGRHAALERCRNGLHVAGPCGAVFAQVLGAHVLTAQMPQPPVPRCYCRAAAFMLRHRICAALYI